MFVPLWDYNRLKRIRFQYVTVGLIITNILVFFLFETGFVFPVNGEMLQGLAVVPLDLVNATRVGEPAAPAGALQSALPQPLTLVTYMFLHHPNSYLHIGGNMLFLWVFGDNVEDAMGSWRFLFFYLTCGICAGLAHVLFTPSSTIPMVGASGAVSGVIGAYLMLHPNVRVWVLMLFRIPLRLSAGFVLGVWILLNVAYAIVAYVQKDPGGTAWWAHVGGFVTGVILIIFMRQPDVPLFDTGTGLEDDADKGKRPT